jgi:hypothetical protein
MTFVVKCNIIYAHCPICKKDIVECQKCKKPFKIRDMVYCVDPCSEYHTLKLLRYLFFNNLYKWHYCNTCIKKQLKLWTKCKAIIKME